MSVQPYPSPERLTAIGYRRASTTEQQASGLGLEAQTTAIEAACIQRGWTLLGFEEDIASGGRKDRPGLARALSAIQDGNADCLVVSRLDRLGRSVAHVASILERHPGAVVALDIGMTPDSPAGAFTAHVIAAAAELERALVRERTRDALRAARERGVVLGRPRQMTSDAVRLVHEMRAPGHTLVEIADSLNRSAVPTPTGRGRWHASGVARALRFAEDA